MTYSIDDGHGNQITTGLQEHEVDQVAKRIANERGDRVYVYGGGAAPRCVDPEATVLGLGDDDWTGDGLDDDADDYAERLDELSGWERYGTVRVRIGQATYEVGVCIGVPEHLRETARAAGGDMVTPYLEAWYVDSSDWSSAPADSGPDGVPTGSQGRVLGAIRAEVLRLWDESR